MHARRFLPALFALTALTLPMAPAQAAALTPDQASFRALFEELVETNTTLSAGSCTLAAERMAAHLRTAGMPEKDIHLVPAPGHPQEGSLVAVLHGSDATLKPMLLLAHIDVVEAKRADWTRDPFTLVEENGYFYARGVADDKAQAAIWVDTLARFLRAGTKPGRTIKLALTCGEETSGAFNGAEYLSTQKRELIDAEFALNEGAWGMLDAAGNKIMLAVQAGEKTAQDYRIEATNPGGHSSRPVKDNAIYALAAALSRIAQHQFPVKLNATTRAYFERMAPVIGGGMGSAMQALAADASNTAAIATVSADPTYNAMLHTTCVATMLDGGHATNALPQRAGANINCRIFPGESVEEVRRALQAVIADPTLSVTAMHLRGPASTAPPLTAAILQPIEAVAARIFPGVPVIPLMQAGATDAQFLGNAGIPTYGINGLFFEPDLGGVHGLNERLRVRSVYEGRDFLFELVKAYAGI